MRIIKFRGYNKKNGQWLYGSHILNRGKHFVAPDEFADGKTWEDYEVEEESIGQFTGLTDKNGKEIYEGDILECYYDREVNPGVVVYVQGAFCLVPNKGKDEPLESLQDFLVGSESGYEVIGNVSDNLDLLK